MTEHNTNPYADPNYRHHVDAGQAYTPPPAPKRKRWFTKPIVLLPAAALILGGVIGSASEPKEVEVIKEVEVPGPERIKTVEKKVEVTPQACITAIDLAQQGFTYSSESMGYMNDALQAAGKFNVPGLEQANRDLEALNPKIKALTEPMRAAVTECRAKQ